MSIKSEKIDGKFIIVEIDSSNLNSGKYDTENEILSVTFNSGSIYEYNKVPWSVFTKLSSRFTRKIL